MELLKAEALALIDRRMTELAGRAERLRRELPLAVGKHEIAQDLATSTLRSVEHLIGLYAYRRADVVRAESPRVRITSLCTTGPVAANADIIELL